MSHSKRGPNVVIKNVGTSHAFYFRLRFFYYFPLPPPLSELEEDCMESCVQLTLIFFFFGCFLPLV